MKGKVSVKKDLYIRMKSIQGSCRSIQGTLGDLGNVQGTFSEHSGNILRTFREHSENIERLTAP
jgi:hypothetical protein